MCAQKKGVCVDKLHGEMRMTLSMHERHERAFLHARACMFECLSFVHCVNCGLHFHLCFVCVPPFSEEGGEIVCECGGFTDHCRDVLD